MTPVPAAPGARSVALLLVYLTLLTWVVLWKLETPWVGVDAMRTLKLVPFAATARAGANEPSEVAVNAALFAPLGLYLGLIAPSWRWRRVAAVVGGTSLALEVTQYVLAVGSADLTDLLVNTVGGLAGFGLLALMRRRLGAATAGVVSRVCAVGTVLAVLATGIVVASPLQYTVPGSGPGLRGTAPLLEDGPGPFPQERGGG